MVWRLGRLGRSLGHLIELVGGLERRQLGFRSLTEGMDTTTSSGRAVFHIFGAIAESMVRPKRRINRPTAAER